MRFVSDHELATLTPAEQRDIASPIPTQVSATASSRRCRRARTSGAWKRASARWRMSWRRTRPEPPRIPLLGRRHVGGLPGHERSVRPGVHRLARRSRHTRRGRRARRGPQKQFIVDCQTHFVRDDYSQQMLTFSADFAKKHWNPDIPGSEGLTRYKFQNYVKEIFIDSDTKVAMISGTPTDEYEYLFLTNDQIASARDVVNKVAGSRRCLGHGIVTPGTPGWFEEINRVMTDLKPDSIKGYTIGDPIYQTKKKTNWRLDDEKLVYPLYESMLKHGINTICIHKGLMPADYMTSWADMWQYATVWDVGKAAKDWPQINFVIYHSAMRPFLELPDRELAQFEKTGRFDWVSDLADIPAKFGVKNVYGELGACFANTCVTHPKLAAALMGTLIKGLGEDKVIWGTDSVWWGSPQWQIEAMRRLEIPEDMQKKYGYKPLGAADGPVKTKIFAGNASKLYKIDPAAANKMSADNFDAIGRSITPWVVCASNLRYGYLAS